jgi:hypothetical protein
MEKYKRPGVNQNTLAFPRPEKQRRKRTEGAAAVGRESDQDLALLWIGNPPPGHARALLPHPAAPRPPRRAATRNILPVL